MFLCIDAEHLIRVVIIFHNITVLLQINAALVNTRELFQIQLKFLIISKTFVFLILISKVAFDAPYSSCMLYFSISSPDRSPFQ